MAKQRFLRSLFRNGKVAQRESLWVGCPADVQRIYLGGRPRPSILSPALGAQENQVCCVKFLDPKARTSMTRGVSEKKKSFIEAAPRPSLFRGVRQFVWNHLEVSVAIFVVGASGQA